MSTPNRDSIWSDDNGARHVGPIPPPSPHRLAPDQKLRIEVEDLLRRVTHLHRTPVGDGGRSMARGVMIQAVRVALLFGVDMDTEESPLEKEVRGLEAEMMPPVVTGNTGFRRFWPRLRLRRETATPEQRREWDDDERAPDNGFGARRGSHD